MISRLGIGGRLFAAFLGISALSLSSGVAGWLILREISAAQGKVNAEAMPAISAAQRTAEASARLVATSPALNAVTSETARLAQERQLAILTDEMESSLGEIRRLSPDPEALARITYTVGRLVDNLNRQSRLVQERLLLDATFRRRSEDVIKAATSIVDLSETLVSNASSSASAVVANLYGLVEDPDRREEAYEALDRLIEEDIYLLDRMFELRLRSSQVGLLTNRLIRSANAEETAEIERDFMRHLTVIRRRVRSIDDPVRRDQAALFLREIEQRAAPSPPVESIFAQRNRLIAIEADLAGLAITDRELATRLNRIVQGMLQTTERFASSTTAHANRALDAGLIALLAATLGSIAVSGLIVWLYVERNLVRRLTGLTGAMQRLAGGDLNITIAEDGTDELRAMAGAVRVFRDEGKRRRELEIERERINEELRRHREELQQLVSERTAQLQEANERLKDEVAQHAEARARAEAASIAKSQFLATMSHEIRTPMTGMLGMTRILADGTLDADQRQKLQIVTSSGEALLAILNDILDYSKIESGKVLVEEVDFSLSSLLDGIAALMTGAAREKGLELTLEKSAELWPVYLGDNSKIRQIVFNLLGNAIKFTEKGSVTISARVAQTADEAQTVHIVVADTGIGIAPEHQETIFEAFAQTDASITRRFGGTGLGLAICRRLADIIGARIEVASAPGKGSAFTLALPLRRGTPSVHEECDAPKRALSGQPLTILVVEDDAATRLVVEGFLRQLGHVPLTAENGYKAIELFTERRPDAVLMDLSMPAMDGIEAARRLRETSPDGSLPIIAMSAHVFSSDVQSHLARGFDAFVGKPLTPESLAAGLAEGLAAKGRPTHALGRGANGNVIVSAPDSDHLLHSLKADLDALGEPAARRLIEVAELTLPDRFAAMRLALSMGDRAQLADLAHATASAAGSVGLRRMLEAARAIEQDAATAAPAGLEALIAECEAAFAQGMIAWRSMFDPALSLSNTIAPHQPTA